MNLNEFAITSYGEIQILQSKDFLSSSAVPRFSFYRSYIPTWKYNIISCYQAFQVGINCTVCILSLNGVVSLNKLSLVHETVRYLVYSEVMKKRCVTTTDSGCNCNPCSREKVCNGDNHTGNILLFEELHIIAWRKTFNFSV